MSCQNKATFHVQRGYSFREIEIQCGRTDPWGGRATCDSCFDNQVEMERINAAEANIKADNETSRASGHGDY